MTSCSTECGPSARRSSTATGPSRRRIDEARAFEDAPVILLDHADNCGSGATQDVMTAIEAVMRAGTRGRGSSARCGDPEAVATMRESGVGAEVELDLGGRTDMPGIGEAGRPLRVSGTVRVLTDGRWTVRGPDVHRGAGRHGPERGPRHRCDADRDRLPPPTSRGTSGCSPRWESSPGTTATSCSSPASTTAPASATSRRLTLTLDGTGVTTSGQRRAALPARAASHLSAEIGSIGRRSRTPSPFTTCLRMTPTGCLPSSVPFNRRFDNLYEISAI